MRLAKVRATLALMVVGVFMIITAVLALYPILSQTNVDLNMYADFFSKTASVYTGIVGVIIGYYFGRALETPRGLESEKPASTSTTDAR